MSFPASGPQKALKKDTARKLPLLVVAGETFLGEKWVAVISRGEVVTLLCL